MSPNPGAFLSGQSVYAFYDCTVAKFGYNPAEYDYGHVIITFQRINGHDVWALYGHLVGNPCSGLEIGSLGLLGCH